MNSLELRLLGTRLLLKPLTREEWSESRDRGGVDLPYPGEEVGPRAPLWVARVIHVGDGARVGARELKVSPGDLVLISHCALNSNHIMVKSETLLLAYNTDIVGVIEAREEG